MGKKRTVRKTTNKNYNTLKPASQRVIDLKSKGEKADSCDSRKESDSSEDNNSNMATTMKPVNKQIMANSTAKKSPLKKQARKSTPQKSDKKPAEADKNGKVDQPKTDIGKELIKTAQNLEDIHEKIEESTKPVKGMDKLEKVKKAHDKLEKVKKELNTDNCPAFIK